MERRKEGRQGGSRKKGRTIFSPPVFKGRREQMKEGRKERRREGSKEEESQNGF